MTTEAKIYHLGHVFQKDEDGLCSICGEFENNNLEYCPSCDNSPCICEIDSSEQDDLRGPDREEWRHEAAEWQGLK
jgi:hypothetical protein